MASGSSEPGTTRRASTAGSWSPSALNPSCPASASCRATWSGTGAALLRRRPNAWSCISGRGAYGPRCWANDVGAARHEGGHTPFSADITNVARARDNVVVVRAEDPLSDETIPRGKQFWTPKPAGIFYTSTAGIWQTVWLEPLPARHINRLRVSPDLAAGAVDFELEAPGRTELIARLDGEVVGRWSELAGRGA